MVPWLATLLAALSFAAAGTALALAPARTAATPFEVVWNAQWPELCPDAHAAPDALSRFGITANEHNAFNGDAITILYNHPGNITLGDWPCVGDGGTEYNGGIPQLGNLSKHLAAVKRDVEAAFPDPQHRGIIAVDWEVWQPWFEFWGDSAPAARWNAYMNLSYAHAGGNKALAVAQWNTSSMAFMAETLKTVVALRPRAKVGYYGVVGCAAKYDFDQGGCTGAIRARNDALAPLWAAGSALFPSIYASCLYNGTGSPPHCDDDSHRELKVPAILGEAQRVNRAALPILPFTWYTLYNAGCDKAPPVGLGHCPLMTNTTDLNNEFALAKAAPGVEGIIVWGSHDDVRKGTNDCATFGRYLNDTLGPFLETLAATTDE